MRASVVLYALLILVPTSELSRAAAPGTSPGGPLVVRANRVAVTPPLRDVVRRAAVQAPSSPGDTTPPREISIGRLPRATSLASLASRAAEPVAKQIKPAGMMPSPWLNFEGISNLDGVYPPDCNGDVGLSQYVEMVNCHMAVYDKMTGATILAPFLMSSLYAAAGFPAPASTSDDGDPVVLYDHLANRWLISQFIVSVTPCHEVIGISQTSDASGAWYLYDFIMPGTDMNDYPKFGVWPDGYYMTDNQFSGGVSWHGAGVFAFDRAKMLVGDASASYQYFSLYGANQNFGGLLPADLDGPPPPVGTPAYFAMMDDGSSVTPGVYAVYVWNFHVDWTTPANSTFGNSLMPNSTNVVSMFNASFTGGRGNIPQPGTAQGLDALSDRLMHRLQYRNFGTYESLVTCHNVNVGTGGANQGGVRYYQLRRTLPAGAFAVAEQATYAPDGASRWMGSAAMDGQGNLAVGYSVSSTSIYPSIAYAGRLAADPSNGLFQGEAMLYSGSGSQTGSAARWGDYTALVVDPVDDCTFYYVNEYMPSTSAAGWHTRIGSFRLTIPHSGVVMGAVTNALTGAPIPGASVAITNGVGSLTDGAGNYSRLFPTGTWAFAASAPDFTTGPVTNLTVVEGVTNVVNFGLLPVPMRVTPATAYSLSGEEGGPFSPVVQTYVVSNAALASFTWTGLVSQAWVALTPAGGTLDGGSSMIVTASPAVVADFLPTGHYAAAIIFSNEVDGATQARPVNLAISSYLPPVVAFYDFSSGLPDGWSAPVDGSGYSWVFDDPGYRGNLTGGTGLFAMLDNWYYDALATNIDAELRTGPLDFRGKGRCLIGFKNDFYNYIDEIADVDVSANGASGPWVNVWRRSGVDERGPSDFLVDISSIAGGASNAMVRFRYRSNGYWGNWWEVDDVTLYAGGETSGNLGIVPMAGLDADGYYGGPFSPSRLYRLTNSAATPVAWTSLWSSVWVSVVPAGGVLAPGTSVDVNVGISSPAETLTPGSYTGQVVFSNLTQSVSQSRNVSLRVMDTLTVTPAEGLVASGLEGGPFSPSNKVFTLENHAAFPVPWAVWHTQSWLSVSSAGGILEAGASQTVTAMLDSASLVVPGSCGDLLVFSNLSSSATTSRDVTVAVIEITGKIEVSDSIAPTNDWQMPFGAVGYGMTRSGYITVRNTGPVRNLVVSNILFGFAFSDFESGSQDWAPVDPPDWSVVTGRYHAASADDVMMVSLYTARVWAASSVQARLHRAGEENNAQGVILRASPNFDANASGSGYLFLLAGEDYSVWVVDHSSAAAIQGWTESPAIDPGGDNTLLASADGTELSLRVNGTVIWRGADSTLASGYAGVCGYTDPSAPTIYDFDNVYIDRAIPPGLAPDPDQLYRNAQPQPDSVLTGPHDYGESGEKKVGDGEEEDEEGEGIDASSAGLQAISGFSLTNVPALPKVLAPGESFTFEVLFTADGLGSNVVSVTVDSNDNDTPDIGVTVSAHTASGVITGTVADAGSGARITGALLEARSGSTVLGHAQSDASGIFSMDVPTGTYSVVVSAGDYQETTQSVTVPADGAVTGCVFVLAASRLAILPADAQSSGGLAGGPFSPAAFVYRLSNTTASAVSWAAANDASWLAVAPSGGTVPAYGGLSVTATVVAAAAALPIGVYDGMLTFSNLTEGILLPRHILLCVRRDYFSEWFAAGGNDLHNMTLTFTPNGSDSYYSVARTENVMSFPTDPSGGTSLALQDDNYIPVTLTGGATVALYGIRANGFFVGSNGYLTFGAGDTVYTESLSEHFSMPRISALFTDLNLAMQGSASWKQLGDRVAVSVQNAPQFGRSNTNSFQYELFTNGVIRLTWLRIDATNGLAGLSSGAGIPGDFVMSDLSAYPTSAVPVFPVILATAGPYGSIAPTGMVTVSYGGTTNFTVAAAPYYLIASILTNGADSGVPFNALATNAYVFNWRNVITQGTIAVQFTEALATNGTPIVWLAQYGLAGGNCDTQALADPDGDGMSTWQEYLAETDPTNPASLFRILSIQAGTNILLGVEPAVSNRLYDIYTTTNPALDHWWMLTGNRAASNAFFALAPTSSVRAAAYKIKVHLP